MARRWKQEIKLKSPEFYFYVHEQFKILMNIFMYIGWYNGRCSATFSLYFCLAEKESLG